MKKFFVLTTILLVRGAFAADPGITDKEIVIGAHTLDSGAFAMFSGIGSAMSAYYDMVNEQGGVDGRKIKFLKVDSKSDFAKAAEGTRKLVEQDKVFAIVGGVGAYHNAVYKYLIEKNIPDVFTNDGASFYTEPPNKVVFPATYSFVQEGNSLGDYIVKNYPGKRICFLLTESVQGKEISKGISEVIERFNKTAKDKLTIGRSETTDRNAVQADAEVSRLKTDKCDVVFGSATGALAAAQINYGFRHEFKPKWISYRYNANDKYLSLIDEGARDGIIATTFIATGESSGLAGWADFKKLMEKNNIVPSGVSAMGYMMAEMFVASLKEAGKQGKDLTREKYLKVVENWKGWKCSICFEPVNLSPANHWPLSPTLLVSKGGQWIPLKK